MRRCSSWLTNCNASLPMGVHIFIHIKYMAGWKTMLSDGFGLPELIEMDRLRHHEAQRVEGQGGFRVVAQASWFGIPTLSGPGGGGSHGFSSFPGFPLSPLPPSSRFLHSFFPMLFFVSPSDSVWMFDTLVCPEDRL